MPEPMTPVPTPQTQPFWDGAARDKLMLQRSIQSGRYFFYPRGFVPGHVNETFEWVEASGHGRLASYIINRRPLPGYENESPIIALVELDEGPRMMTNIVDVEPIPENLRIGARVAVEFRRRGEVNLPFFKLVGES